MAVFETVGLVLVAFLAFLLALHITIFVAVLTFDLAHEWLQRWQRKHLTPP